MTSTAWPRRRRTNASMAPLESGCVRVRNPPDRLAEAPWPQRHAVAGRARPVPGVALGGDAAADPGLRCPAVLRAVPGALSHRSDIGASRRRRRPAALERTGLLRARAQPAS